LDLENAVLFGNQTAVIQSPSRRGLVSKSFKHRKMYIASRWHKQNAKGRGNKRNATTVEVGKAMN
jgi:hypothetical protein